MTVEMIGFITNVFVIQSAIVQSKETIILTRSAVLPQRTCVLARNAALSDGCRALLITYRTLSVMLMFSVWHVAFARNINC